MIFVRISARIAAPAFAVTPVTVAARSAAELERAVGAFARAPNGGLMVLPDVTNLIHRDEIIALAARHRLPAVYPYRYYAASGGLLSYGSEQADMFRRAAGYVDRILKGEKPADLPADMIFGRDRWNRRQLTAVF